MKSFAFERIYLVKDLAIAKGAAPKAVIREVTPPAPEESE